MLTEKQLEIRKNQAIRHAIYMLHGDQFKIKNDKALCEYGFTYYCLVDRLNDVNNDLKEWGNPLSVVTEMLDGEQIRAIDNEWLPLKVVMEL